MHKAEFTTGKAGEPSRLLMVSFPGKQLREHARSERGDGPIFMRAHNKTPGRTHDDEIERQRESWDRFPFVSAS
jgi:hypothetical protein